MKRVIDWGADRVGDYIERLRRGKQQIDDARQKVDLPVVTIDGKLQKAGTKVAFRGVIELTFAAKQTDNQIYVAEGNADPTNATATREKINGSSPLVIRENKTIRYAVQDSGGAWSSIGILQLVNENEKFEFKVGQKSLDNEEFVSIVFPKDRQSFEATCRSLFTNSLKRSAVNAEELEASVRALLDELRKA